MKKLLIFINILSIFIMVGVVNSYAATENIYYNYEIIDNHKYNLDTGVFELDNDYYITSKIVLKDRVLNLEGINYHHILIFNKWNKFLGYYNSVNTFYNTSNYITTITDNYIEFDDNVYSVVFMNSKTYQGSSVDEPIADLNNYSLREVFEDYNLLFPIESLVLDGSAAEWQIVNGNYRLVKTGSAANEFNPEIDFKNSILINNYNIYYRFKIAYGFPYASTVYRFRVIHFTGNVSHNTIDSTVFIATDALQANIFEEVNEIDNYSYYSNYNWGIEIRLQRGQYSGSLPTGTFVEFDSSYGFMALDLNAMGLENVLLETIDSYAAVYVSGGLSQYDPLLTIGDFDSVNPYYEREELINDNPENAEGFLDKILSDMGYNNPEGKSLLAAAVIVIIVGGLAIMKAHFSILLFTAIALFVTFSFIGWLPLWINIILALLAIFFIIMKFKGSGGGDSE